MKELTSAFSAAEKTHAYEAAFKEITSATGIADLDELVSSFIHAEDSNFELFSLVNTLSAECGKLEEQIRWRNIYIHTYL